MVPSAIMRGNYGVWCVALVVVLTACSDADVYRPSDLVAVPGINAVQVDVNTVRVGSAEGDVAVVVPAGTSESNLSDAKSRAMDDPSDRTPLAALEPDTRYAAYAAAYDSIRASNIRYRFFGRRYNFSEWIGPVHAWTAKEMVVRSAPDVWVSGEVPPEPVAIDFVTRNGDIASAAIGGAMVVAEVASGNVEIVSGMQVQAEAGVATFDALAVEGAGAFTLSFSVPSEPGFAALTVTGTLGDVILDATRLAVASQPTSLTKGELPSEPFVVELQDISGERVAGTSARVRVTAPYAALGSEPLVGTLEVTATDGRAVFDDFRVATDFAGTGLDVQFEQVDTGDGTPLQSSNTQSYSF